MNKLQYRDFLWPENPETCVETVTRQPIYVTESGLTRYSGMTELRRVISGEGVFSGEGACEQYQLLRTAAELDGVGTLHHPLWGSRNCYCTKLEAVMEPREDFVRYRFEFMGADSNGEVPRG